MRNSHALSSMNYVYLIALVIFGMIGLNEFVTDSPHNVLHYCILGLTFCCALYSGSLVTAKKRNVRLVAKIVSFLILWVILIHAILNSINIYTIATLPPLFYTLKLYRFISLSPLCLIQVLSVSSLVFLGTFRTLKLKEFRKDIFSTVAVCILSLFIGKQLQSAVAKAYTDTVQVSVNLDTQFDERFTYRSGGSQYYGWIWPYTQFLIRHIPEDSIIAIPPQSNVWKMEGNSVYIRWFLYPRKTVWQNTDGSIPDSADFVLITIGECSEGACGWPKVFIPKDKIEYISLINRENQEETNLYNIDYSMNIDLYKWGVIKLKK